MATPVDPAPVPTSLSCARCGSVLRPGTGHFFRITIEAAADPWPPLLGEADLVPDLRQQIERLLVQMQDLSEQEAMDQVYRRTQLYLCSPCYRTWIQNPVA